MLLYTAMVKEVFDWKVSSPFGLPDDWLFLDLDWFRNMSHGIRNMFHSLLKHTNNFCFEYIAISRFFETFPAGRLENLILMKTQS